MEKERTPMSGHGTMDRLISDCSRHGLFMAPTDGLDGYIKVICGASCVRIGDLVFHANRHSTGCSVHVWVVDGADALMVRNTTYWYSHNYTFNEPHNVYGAWDPAIDAACTTMRDAILEREEFHARKAEVAAKEKETKEAELHGRFAQKFINPA